MNLVALEFVACQQAKENLKEEYKEQLRIHEALPRAVSLEVPGQPSLLLQQEVVEELLAPDGSSSSSSDAKTAAAPAATATGTARQRRHSLLDSDGDRGPGVLILSEFAGAAEFLKEGSIIINPWNEQQSAEALYTGLTMPAPEREWRHRYLLTSSLFFFHL